MSFEIRSHSLEHPAEEKTSSHAERPERNDHNTYCDVEAWSHLSNVQDDLRAERVGSEDWFGSFFSSRGEPEGAAVGHLRVSSSKSFFGVSRAATLNPKTTT